MLEFETEIDGGLVNGVDDWPFKWNEAGRTSVAEAMIRPLSGR